MRTLPYLAVLLALTSPLAAQDTLPDEVLSVAVEPLGDAPEGVAARVSVRYYPDTSRLSGEIVLTGSIEQEGRVVRTFRRPVRPDEIQHMAFVEVLPAGEFHVVARLHATTPGGAPLLLGRSETTITLVPMGREYVASAADGVTGMLAEGVVPETAGAVKIRAPRRDLAPNLFEVVVDVLPPVRRVEFWVGERRIFTRNAPPYVAELDLGTLPKRVEVRAIGYDARGRYIDADVFVVSERENPLDVKILRTETREGISQIRVSVQNRVGLPVREVELYADDRRLIRWEAPPYALALATTALEGTRFLRASATNVDGVEATDILFLDGTQYVENIEVNLVELPVTVTAENGGAVLDLTKDDFVVKEAGREVEIAKFDFASNLPLTVGVIVDHSGSMVSRIDTARSAALEFFRSVLGERDRAFFGGFSWDATSVSPIVSDMGALQSQAMSMPDAEGATALYDAVVTGLYQFRGIEGRRALVIVSDGEDTASRTDYDQVLRYVRSARVPVYVIGIGLSTLTSGRIRALAGESGGSVYYIRSAEQLSETYAALEKELRTQYLLGYYAAGGGEGTYRPVEVTIPARRGLKVRTIRGYIP